ncbi:LIC11874 family lipoprotein [Leptospira santarosai]|uniref:Lipoprotein n=2 Tax=Leptospira santarosai TaxID=28183 RepID=A0AB73MB98_9LEPT|nr:hypothetical protein [Leptospira santarosai]AVV50836.1 Uncharacterized protein XB17_02253 [Leptospira santarosai]AVV79584.1 Uncharacterized protein XB15_01810 [Leptospira santarosai]EKO33922.1 hypothetical protein LEP1GSC179_2157 [Leptospira santarosai str. MOR084]MBW9233459.1 hypothetical protein [Leptospira santarosai]MDI7156146.1 hypothetical protein [Leptospira santarosai]
MPSFSKDHSASFGTRCKCFLLITLSLFFSNCFDYEETLTINHDFSGTLEVSYVVPTRRNSDESLIKFLPTLKDEILGRLNKGFFSKNVSLKDYTYQKIVTPETDPSLFREKAKVYYKVEFQELSQIEGAMLGKVQVRKKGNTIYVKREIPTISRAPETLKKDGEKKIYSETLRLLRTSSILFKVNFPIASVCRSNRGDVNLGRLSYRLPLTETIEKTGNNSWDYRITVIY